MDREASRLGIEEGEDQAQFFRQRRQRENLRDSHKRIRFARGDGFRSGTDRLTVSDPDGETREIVDKDEMEQILMATNREKFTHANVTPFM